MRWRVAPVARDTMEYLGAGHLCLTYRGARRLADRLNAERADEPEAWLLPPFRWLVIDERARKARERADQ